MANKAKDIDVTKVLPDQRVQPDGRILQAANLTDEEIELLGEQAKEQAIMQFTHARQAARLRLGLKP
jgi:hypothetical protein